MARDDILLDDDYVAKLLEKDAKELRGMFNLSSSSQSKPANKLKPNTRFLRNIIKETDSHNAALLAKEAADAQARLNSLSAQEAPKKVTRAPLDVRKRQLGDIAAILGGGGVKRKRVVRGEKSEGEDGKRRNYSSDADKPAERNIVRNVAASEDAPEKPREKRPREGDQRKRERSRSPRRHVHNRNRSRERRADLGNSKQSGSDQIEKALRLHHSSSSAVQGSEKRRRDETRKRSSKGDYSDEDDRERRHKRHRRHMDTSRERGRNREGEERRRRHHHSRSRSPHERRKHDSKIRSKSPDEHSQKSRRSRFSPSRERESSKGGKHKSLPDEEAYDSDPLSSIIGPLPTKVPELKTRGRGTFSHNAGIDSRFSADYDPTADVVPDDVDGNDWDQALEALRDRTKWKQQGADRLKAAGFTDDEISKWEKGGEKREEDVRWSKMGESREWDRGKVVDDDGGVSIEPKFGRLKDS